VILGVFWFFSRYYDYFLGFGVILAILKILGEF
jgi:hypothetical protein